MLRAEVRRRWRTWLMLALIAGLFAGAVQAAAAGARRTDAAYPSLVAWSRPPDALLLSFPGQSRTFAHVSPAAAGRLPQVTEFAILDNYTVAVPADVSIYAPQGNAVPDRFWHRKILAGRLADPARPDEADISFTLADASHLGVGDLLRAALLTPAGRLVWFRFKIVGAAWPAWRAARPGRVQAGAAAGTWAARVPGRSPRLAAAATAGIGSVAAVIGLRLALQPGAGRTALPVRSTIASAVVGVAALRAALVFSASLGNLLATPRLYGVTWDAAVKNLLSAGVGQAARSAATDPAVAAWAEGSFGIPLTIRGVGVGGIAMLPGHSGSLLPVLTQGRLPRGPGEIVLGERTLATTGGHLGGTVSVSLENFRPHPLTVVGIAVFPYLDDTLGLGRGVALTVAGTQSLLPSGVSLPPLDTLVVRFRPSAASGQARLDDLEARLAREGPFVTVGPTIPADVVNFGRVGSLPLFLGGVLSLLAMLTITHLLLTSVRRRRRDFAVLRTLGFTRR